jgi:hypothetical protein
LRAADRDLALAAQLFKDPKLRCGWQLAAGAREGSERKGHADAKSLLDAFVESSLCHAVGGFLEHALWKALTEVTFDGCCRYDRRTVRSFLDQADELISSQALSVRLPRIDRAPILSRWITDVLQPLADNWRYIQCCRCQSRATEPGAVRLRITGMTSEGTIEGRMTCTNCRHAADKVTLLTHCHACGHYPLIIGKNPLLRVWGPCLRVWGLQKELRTRGSAC